MLDLKKSLDNGTIDQVEYNLMNEKNINDICVWALIEKFDYEDDKAQNREASFNIEL